MKKWIPILIALLAGLSGVLEPSLTHAAASWAASDPKSAAAVATLVLAVYHGLESPPAVAKAVNAPAALVRKKPKE